MLLPPPHAVSVQGEVNELHDTVGSLSEELAHQQRTVVELESARDHLQVRASSCVCLVVPALLTALATSVLGGVCA
jgi:hypothetical protein